MEMVGNRKKAAVIVNAIDDSPTDIRSQKLEDEITALRNLGFDPREIDLRDYFQDSTQLKSDLADFGLVWVRGGNCFILRRAFSRSGADVAIRELLEDDALVYGAYSAGIDMLTPSLHGAELVDDPHIVPEGYDQEIIWDGMGILDYAVAPHYKSDHPESAAIDKSVEYLIDNHILFKALRDGEVILRQGENEEVVI